MRYEKSGNVTSYTDHLAIHYFRITVFKTKKRKNGITIVSLFYCYFDMGVILFIKQKTTFIIPSLLLISRQWKSDRFHALLFQSIFTQSHLTITELSYSCLSILIFLAKTQGGLRWNVVVGHRDECWLLPVVVIVVSHILHQDVLHSLAKYSWRVDLWIAWNVDPISACKTVDPVSET